MVVIHTLNNKEEELALQQYKKDKMKLCDSLIKTVTNCTRDKTISLWFGACSTQMAALNECLKSSEEQLTRERIKYLRAKIAAQTKAPMRE